MENRTSVYLHPDDIANKFEHEGSSILLISSDNVKAVPIIPLSSCPRGWASIYCENSEELRLIKSFLMDHHGILCGIVGKIKGERAMNVDRIFYMVLNPNGRMPSFRHDTHKSAVDEAQRLAKENPGQEFFILVATDKVMCENPVKVIELIPF